jgi:hypothetical protein
MEMMQEIVLMMVKESMKRMNFIFRLIIREIFILINYLIVYRNIILLIILTRIFVKIILFLKIITCILTIAKNVDH